MAIPTSRTHEAGRLQFSRDLCNGCGLCIQVCKDFEHLVGCGDDFGVGLERALGDDHVAELLRQVDIRLLQGPRSEAPASAGAARAYGRVA